MTQHNAWKRFGLCLLLMVGATPVRGERFDQPILPAASAKEDPSPLQEALEAYQAERWERSLQLTEERHDQLPAGPWKEAAAFLLGDIHFRMGRNGRPNHLDAALNAFQSARIAYPGSENAARSLLRSAQIYTELGLDQESLASYQRVLSQYPKSRFTLPARVEIVQKHLRLRQWEQASAVFEKTPLDRLSRSDRFTLISAQAQALYHRKAFDQAYAFFHRSESTSAEGMRKDPALLFLYGQAAFQSGNLAKANTLFQTVSQLHSQHPLASFSVYWSARVARKEGHAALAEGAYASLQRHYPESPAARLAVAAQTVDRLPPICVHGERPPLSSGCLESSEADERSVAFRSTILDAVRSFFGVVPMPPSAIEALSELTDRLAEMGYPGLALAVAASVVELGDFSLDEQGPWIERMQTQAAASIQRAASRQDDLAVIRHYYAHPIALTPSMLIGPAGIQIARSHARLGLLTEAIDLYEPIAASPNNPYAEETLYALGRLLLEDHHPAKAERKLKLFLSRYPKSRWAPETLRNLARAHVQRGQWKSAIAAYRRWLKRYAGDPSEREVLLELAELYRRSKDDKNENALYRQWWKRFQNPPPDLHLRTADSFYRLGKYAQAVRFYRLAETEESASDRLSWIRFHMAKSLLSLGQSSNARELLIELGRGTEDSLVRGLAQERLRLHEEGKRF